VSLKCSVSRREYKRRYYQENKEKVGEYQRKYRKENKEFREKAKEYKRWYDQENKDEVKEYKRRYYQENREKIAKKKKEWRQKNSDYKKEYNKEYYRKNKEEFLTRVVKRRARKLQATPPWTNLIDEYMIRLIYQNCPEGYHVDHIVPLQGVTVRGLHVPWNLQYLPAEENTSKGNRYWPDMWEENYGS
jgi:hypothetical protein